MENPRKVITLLTLVFGGLIFLGLSSSLFFTIGNGERGTIFHQFSGGQDVETIYNEGFHVKAPWDKITIYNVKKQEANETMEVLSNNGLEIMIDVSTRYRPVLDKVGYLHNQVGPNYARTIIIPEVRSATRKVIGKYTPEELYSSKREAIQQEIFDMTSANLEANFIFLDALLIRSVMLPATIKTAIEGKLKQEQISQEYEFRISKERKEAERKSIEAKGIYDFQTIVSKGINSDLLKWKGIEATRELAESPNTKVVIIGAGDSGLPIILGGDK